MRTPAFKAEFTGPFRVQHLIRSAFPNPDAAVPEVPLRVDRRVIAKRIWRGTADDGTEFGFQLEVPLKDGEAVWQTPAARYVLRQQSEPVLEISLEIASSAAAGLGWAIGNLHLELCAEPARLLAPDEPAVRQLLERLQVPSKPTTAIFRPGRFARGDQSTHELGPSHKH